MNEIDHAERLARLEREVRSGQRAKNITDDPIYWEILSTMRNTLYDNLESSAWKSVDEREEIVRMLKTITAFDNEFQRRVSHGQVAQGKIAQLTNKVKGMFA